MSKMRWITMGCLMACAVAASSCKEEDTKYTFKAEDTTKDAEAAPAVATTPAPTAAAPPPMLAAAPNPAKKAPSIAAPADRPKLGPETKVVSATVEGVSFTVPETWKSAPPSNSMRAAQYTIPGPEGSGPADAVFFYFGNGGGGSAAENITRWAGQVESAGAEPTVYQSTINGLTVSEVIARGTLRPTGMGGGPTNPVPNSMMYGVIVEGGPNGSVFLKITGPQATVEGAQPAIHSMIGSLNASKPE